MNIEALVQDYATEATDAFLNKGIPLNESITKIASREDLETEKIARIVEHANKEVYLSLFKEAEDKTFTFDVADPREIVQNLRSDMPHNKVASAPMAKSTAIGTPKDVQWTTEQEKQAALGTPLQRANEIYQNLKIVQEVANEAKTATQRDIFDSTISFCKVAEQMVVQDGYSYQEIFEALATSRPKYVEKIATLLKMTAKSNGHEWTIENIEDICKVAAALDSTHVPYGLTIGGEPVQIINGDHKIIVALDTLVDQTTDFERINKNVWGVDDTVRYYRKVLNNFMSQEKDLEPCK